MKIISITLLLALFSTSCKKNIEQDNNPLNRYTGLPDQTLAELRHTREATSRYVSLDSALADGYADISVDVEHMGHHYMKSAIVDPVFDMHKPEILVYNRDENGKPYLVAVEYAIPLTHPKPEGFSGNADIWKDDSGFPLWLLHAWIWEYNPQGVFNWTNPLVHMH
jgi:hypothetical protein